MDNKRLNKNDKRVMLLMTAIYLIIALLNLGSLKAPKTGWEPERLNEQIVVDFGREVEIDKIMLFGGLGHAWGAFGTLKFDAWQNGDYVTYTSIDMKSIYKWHYSVDKIKTSKLRISNQYLNTDIEGDKNRFYEAEYKEIAFFNGASKIKDFTITQQPQTPGAEKLFDEPGLVPDRPTYLNGTYFDEIYFPRTALEQLEHRSVLYENTHPPLGKTILGFGISLFGMNPFGWRIMGTLFGAALVPLMYLIAKRLFKDSFWAFFSAFLMMFDFMHFTQTRLATIDSYTVFFVMATYYCMLVYYDSNAYEKGFFKSIVPLLFSGIFLGLGAATKWICLYGAFGIAILFFLSRGFEYESFNNALNRQIRNQSTLDYSEKSGKLTGFLGKYFYLTCLVCIIFFIVIPALIYVAAYIPIQNVKDNRTIVQEVLDSIKNMYNYHKGVTSPHPFSSSWYEWPLSIKPIFYFSGSLLAPGMGSSISSFGNPLVWWIGFLAFLATIVLLVLRIFKKNIKLDSTKLILFPLLGYLSLYVPWIVAPRKLTFIYHYFSCIPFLILFVAIIFRFMENSKWISRKVTHIYLGLVCLLFIIYYPVLSGLEVPRWYLEVLQLLPSWSW